jgi:hypothetical protein
MNYYLIKERKKLVDLEILLEGVIAFVTDLIIEP